MGGLARICRAYGGMKVTGNDGATINYVWDYVADVAVPDTEMPRGSKRHRASERRKHEMIREEEAESLRQVAAAPTEGGGRG